MPYSALQLPADDFSAKELVIPVDDRNHRVRVMELSVANGQ